MKWLLIGVAAVLLSRSVAGQAVRATVVDAGPGDAGHNLAAILARTDTRVIVRDTIALTRDSAFSGSVVVIGQHVTVSGRVRGDLVVVGGNLFVKPGAVIDGQGIAIGGAAYPSMLAIVQGGLISYRDFTFDALSQHPNSDTVELSYREVRVGPTVKRLEFPLYGLRVPSYDRANGLSLPIGPLLTLDDGKLTMDVRATYRSQLGRLDPSVDARWDLHRNTWASAFAGRETRSNEGWISGRLSNSISVLLNGSDNRNWYRANAADLQLHRSIETRALTSTYSVGAQIERASAVRPDSFATGGPWSIFGRKSLEGIRRPNPQSPGGSISSALLGAGYLWNPADIKARLDVGVELPFAAPDGRFVQTTIDGQISFPTFGKQRYRFETHGIVTVGDTAPAQRFGYLGGPGTLPTEDLLVMGGDELLLFESRYEIPIERIVLPFAGSPVLMFRHILGSTGVQRIPDFTQIVGLRLSASFVRLQVLMDTEKRKPQFSFGLSLTR